MRFFTTGLTTLLFATSSILAFDVDVRRELRIQQDAQQMTEEILVITEYDLKPSMEWATVQIESLVPTELVTPNTTTPAPAPLPLIRNALFQLSKIVVQELRPGLKNAIVQLIKTHANNPDLADQLISREELMVFVNQVSQTWSDTIDVAIRKWSHEHLDGLINAVGRILVGVGKEVFKRLGQLGGFLLNHNRRNQCRLEARAPKNDQELLTFIKVTATDVASTSLTFLHGPGWMSSTATKVFRKNPNMVKSHPIF